MSGNRFVIGQMENKALHMDVLKLVNSRAIIQANSGGGKSWLFRVIAEQCAGKVPTIIIDPEGEFATLREKFDFALIGRNGETSIDLRSAALLARKLIELNISAIVNLSDLDDIELKREYLKAFLTAMMSVPQKFWHPALILLDEAHKFCPEKGEVASSRAVINLMDSGRKRGFAGLLATQRLSKLHKDAAAEGNNVFVGRTWLDLDQERAGDLMGMKKADRIMLRDLEPGQFFAFGPALEANGVVKFRSSSVQTTHPKPGERHALSVPRASEAIQEIVQQIGDLPAQAVEEAHTVDALTKENAQLRRELNARPIQMQPKIETVIERVEAPILREGELDRLEAALQGLKESKAHLEGIAGEISTSVNMAQRAIASTPKPKMQSWNVTVRPSMPKVEKSSVDGSLTLPQQRILDAMAWLESVSLFRPKRTVIAFLAGQSPKSSGFKNNLGALRSAGLLTYAGSDAIELTDNGRSQANSQPTPVTAQEVQDAVISRLPRPQARILEILIEAYPNPVDRNLLAERAGQSPTSSGYKNNLGALRSLGVIEYAGSAACAALPVLFLE